MAPQWQAPLKEYMAFVFATWGGLWGDSMRDCAGNEFEKQPHDKAHPMVRLRVGIEQRVEGRVAHRVIIITQEPRSHRPGGRRKPPRNRCDESPTAVGVLATVLISVVSTARAASLRE